MNYNAARALELLRIGTGHADATFRDGQEAAIRHFVEGQGRLLVVQKTGWGKSLSTSSRSSCFVKAVAALKIQHAVRGESWRPGRLNLDLCVDALLQPAAGLSAPV